MTFQEMILTLIQRPGYLGVLANQRIVRLNKAGYLLDARFEAQRYVRIHTNDVMAVTWECWTPQQIADMAMQNGMG